MNQTRRNKQVKIGIVTAPMPLKQLHQAQSYLDRGYVSWVQMSGADAVIIPYNSEMLSTYLSSVHGVVWVGGGIENKKTHSKQQYNTFVHTMQEIYEHAVRENDRGNYFPMWGTCLGFDLLAMMNEKTHGDYFDRIQHVDKHRLAPLVFKGTSRLRSAIPKKLQLQIAHSPVVQHIHQYGFDLKSPHTKKLTSYLKIVSVDKADNGVEFMNMFEYKNYPFYGCQWHPEKPLTDLGVELSYTLSLFLNKECSKNNLIAPRWSKVSESGKLSSKFSVLLKGGSYFVV
jgi:gamma-glutamyl hydrolase